MIDWHHIRYLQALFCYPFDGASDTSTFESDLTWTDFGYWVSDIMGICAKSVNLAYHFSMSLQRELPQMLSTPLHLECLFNNACKIINERAMGKSKSTKEFRVILVDQNTGKKGGDESAHQILSYGLLFLPFYHFPSTADPPTCTMLMQSSTRLTWSPLTIHYTHCTISPAPCCRLSIWPTYHIVLFPILSSFSITRCVLLWANWSQAIALCGQDLTICFITHKPCACFIYYLYLKLLYLLPKNRKFFPQEFRLSAFCLIISPCSVSYHHPILHFRLSSHSHTIPNPRIISYSLISHQQTIHYPQIAPSVPHKIYT